MKSFALLAVAVSALVAGSAQAQDRQVTVSNGPVSIELPASMLRGSTPVTADTAAPRKVRIIMASPYGN